MFNADKGKIEVYQYSSKTTNVELNTSVGNGYETQIIQIDT